MTKIAKEYMRYVIETLMRKYSLSEHDARKIVKASFLYNTLEKYPNETLHDDIETNADFVHEDYVAGRLDF